MDRRTNRAREAMPRSAFSPVVGYAEATDQFLPVAGFCNRRSQGLIGMRLLIRALGAVAWNARKSLAWVVTSAERCFCDGFHRPTGDVDVIAAPGSRTPRGNDDPPRDREGDHDDTDHSSWSCNHRRRERIGY